MSARHLPPEPSLRHLKNEAKQLHKSLRAGDGDATERVCAGLPRLFAGEAVDGVTLMEVQHVLARDYGFREWPDLVAAVELDFEALVELTDTDIQVVLREVDQRDLVISLKSAGEDLKEKLLRNLSERVRTFLTEEMEFLGPMPVPEVEDVRRRLVQHVRQLGKVGRISWPLGSGTPPRRPRVDPEPLAPELVELLETPFESMCLDDVCRLCRLLSQLAGEHGIVALDRAARCCVSSFVDEGLRLASDGTEAALLEDLLRTRARTLVRHQDTRMDMIVEAAAAIQSCDNPAVVTQKVSTCYAVDARPYRDPQGTVEKLRDRLRDHPVSRADLDELTMVLTDLAHVRRRQGVDGLAQMIEHIDDRFLADAVRRVVDGGQWQRLQEKQRLLCDEARRRLRLFTAGIAAIQEGRKGVDLDTAMDAVLSAD